MGRFAMLVAAVAGLIGVGLSLAGNRAEAIGLCNCCASSLTPSCGKVCAAISLTPGVCPAIVDYEGTGATAKGANPLNGMSLKEFLAWRADTVAAGVVPAISRVRPPQRHHLLQLGTASAEAA
jgi:hypothetical protein